MLICCLIVDFIGLAKVGLFLIRWAEYVEKLIIGGKSVPLQLKSEQNEHLDYHHSPNVRRPLANGRGSNDSASSLEDEGRRTP